MWGKKAPRKYGERLREQDMFVFRTKKKRLSIYVTVCRYIKGQYKEEKDRLFSLAKDNRRGCSRLSCRKDLLS